MITTEEFTAYVDAFESDSNKIALQQVYIEAATQSVIDYLNYDPSLQTYVDTFYGNDSKELQLYSRPITAITSITKDGVAIATTDVRIKSKGSEWIVAKDIFEVNSEIVVTYTAGYDSIPGAIKLAVLRIAALMHSESQGNIGVTSKSFQDQSRQFQNFTSYAKYLTPLDGYRIMRL